MKWIEQELAAVQRAYAEEQRQYRDAQETNIILVGLLDVQERMAAVYKKQQHWMAAGGPTEACPEQDTVLLTKDRPGWVMYLFETATWEQQ